MKNILLVMFFLLNTTCFSQFNINTSDYNPLEISNNIKSINYKVYQVTQKYGNNEEKIIEDLLIDRDYDINNNLIKETHKDNIENLIKREFIFNYQLNILQESVETNYIVFSKPIRPLSVIKSKYDSINNRIQFDKYINDGKLSNRVIFKYDSNNNVIEENSYWEDGLSYSIKKKYDSNNNLIEIIDNNKVHPSGERTLHYYYEYDLNNNLIKSKDPYIGTITYKYDLNNNIIERTENGNTDFFKKRFDSNNNLIEVIMNETYRTTYKYDSNNNMSEMLEYSVDESFEGKTEILKKKTCFNIKYRD